MRTSLFPTLLTCFVMLSACDKVAEEPSAPGEDTHSPSDPPDEDSGEPMDWEEGCILVSDIDRGFATLADALTQAADGATVTLCAGTLAETAEITRPVSIVGPGAELLTWEAPTNQPGVTIDGVTGVSLSGFSMTSSRNGIEIANSSEISLAQIDFPTIGNTAVKISESTEVLLEGVSATEPAYGAVQIEGGSLTARDLDVVTPGGFAVKGMSGAAITLEGWSASSTYYTTDTPEKGVDDGFALWLESGSSALSSGGVLSENFLHYFIDSSSLTVQGDAAQGGYYGIYAIQSDLSVDGFSSADALIYGLVSAGLDTSNTLNDVTLTHSEKLAIEGAVGLLMNVDSATISGLSVSGFQGTGAIITPYDNALELSIDGADFSGNGGSGLYIESASGTLSDINVSDQRLDSEISELWADSVPIGYGSVVLYYSNMDWDGGVISGSDYNGVVNVQGSLTASNLQVELCEFAGIFNFYGSAVVSESTFTRSSGLLGHPDVGYFDAPGFYSYYGDSIIQDSTFIDNRESTRYDINKEDADYYPASTSYYLTHNSSRDVVSQGSSRFHYLNNTATNGSYGIFSYGDTDILLQDSSWEGYNTQAVTLYVESDEAVMENLSFQDVGSYAIYSYQSDWDATDLSFSGSASTLSHTAYYDASDSLIQESTSEYRAGQFYNYDSSGELDGATFRGLGVYGFVSYYGNLDLSNMDFAEPDTSLAGTYSYDMQVMYPTSLYAEDVSIQDAQGSYALYLYNSYEGGVIEFDGLSITGDGAYYGLYISSYANNTQAHFANTEITKATYNGFYGYSSSSYSSSLSFDGVDFNNNGSDGIYVYGYESVDLDNVTATNNQGEGINLYDISEITGSGWTLQDNSSYGAYLYGSSRDFSATLDNLSVQGSGSHGLYAYRGDLSLSTPLTLTDNGQSGLFFYGGDMQVSGQLDALRNDGSGVVLSSATGSMDGDLQIQESGSYGLELSASHFSYLGGSAQLSNNGSSNLRAYNGSSLYGSNMTLSGADAAGADFDDSDLELSLSEISSHSGTGLEMDGGLLVLSESHLNLNGVNGLTVTGSELELSGNIMSGNNEYGMVCTGLNVFTVCEDNDLEGNLVGTHSGCDECVSGSSEGPTPPGGGDTGGDSGEDSGLGPSP